MRLFAILTAILLGMTTLAGGVGVGVGVATDAANRASVPDVAVAGNNGAPDHSDGGDDDAPPVTNGTDPPASNETGSLPLADNGTQELNGSSQQTDPTVAANCTPASVPAGSSVTCRAVVTSGTAQGFDWQFGDNSTATGPNITRRYGTPGNRTVTVVAIGPNGTAATATVEIAVGPPETPPTAKLNCSTTTLRVGKRLSCSGENSTDERGVTSYEWRFGDGNGDIDATDSVVEHRYDEPGEHTVALTVTDTNGTTDVAQTVITVNPDRPPVAQLDCPTATLRVGQEFACAATGSNDDGQIVKYEWTFDDGTTATTPRVGHTYDRPGNRTVTLTVTDDRGATDTAQTTVAVTPNNPPTVGISCAPESPAAGRAVRCAVRDVVDPDGSVTAIRWTFGDGRAEATGRNNSHVYTRGGEYTVRAVAVDDDGAETAATTTVTVAPNRPPTATIRAEADPVVVGEPVTLKAVNISDPDGRVRRVNWSIGGEQAFSRVVTHRFETSGNHDVTLRLTDDDGHERTLRRTLTVLERPSMRIERRPTRPRVNQSVVLTAADAPNGSRVAWDTDGDGEPEQRGRRAVTRFGAAGRHLVTATVTTPAGVTVRRSTALVVRQGAAFRLNRDRRTVTAGESVALRLRVSNRGADRPIEAKLELDLPPGLSVVDAGGPGLDGPASTQFVTVPAGRTTSLRVTVRADESGSYRLSGTAVHYYADQTLRRETTLEPRQIEVAPRPTTVTATEEHTRQETPSTPTASGTDARDDNGDDTDIDPVVGASFLTLLVGFLLRTLR